MIDMTDIVQVKTLQDHIRLTFNNDSGKKVMEFLEQSCGWYDTAWTDLGTERIMANIGKREVLATIKTLMELTSEQVVALITAKEGM